jgi:hypothetical protein
VKSWLLSRQPAPPADLATRLAQCVDAAPEAVLAGDTLPEVVGALGTWLLASVVERQRTAYDAAPDGDRAAIDTSDAPPAGSRRESGATALDLLAADAFVTYAFEAASEEGTDVSGLATRLLTRVRA